MKDQRAWVPARLMGCRATDSAGQIWKCRRSYHKVVQGYEGTFKQEQYDWGVIRGVNVQLDLNGRGVEVVRSSGQRISSLIESPCKEYNNIKVTSLGTEYKGRKKETTVQAS